MHTIAFRYFSLLEVLEKAVSEIARYGPAGLQIENKMSDEWVVHD